MTEKLTEEEVKEAQGIQGYLGALLMYITTEKEIVTSDELSDFKKMVKRAESVIKDILRQIQYLEEEINSRKLGEWDEGK